MSEDFYATLGVAPTASDAEIERAYRRLARAHHPDLLRRAPMAERGAAEERLKAINRAHHSLGDRERRVAYDRHRRQLFVPSRPIPSSPDPSAVPPAARPGGVSMAGPAIARSWHRAGGGAIDVERATTPPVVARRGPDLFTVGRLLRYALLIILFALLLDVLWHPAVAPPAVPTPASAVTIPVG